MSKKNENEQNDHGSVVLDAPQKKRVGPITIRPFVLEGENMGLEKYGMVVHEGCDQGEQLTCLENNGVRQYVTGLNEFSPDIRSIVNSEDKAAAIKEIRTKVIFLEQALASNQIDIDDEKFWDKVKVVRPDSYEFWDKISLRVGNNAKALNPEVPMDLILITAIEAGGFNMIGKSLEDARARGNNPPKFYLDRMEQTASTKTEVTKLKNIATSELVSLGDKNPKKLFYIAKCLDGRSEQYKKNTPADTIYDNMDLFINGRGIEKRIKVAAQSFIDASKETLDNLKIKAIIKDANFYKYIHQKGDGKLYHVKSDSMMGGNISECFQYLKNPLNQKILEDLVSDVETQWEI